MGLGLQPTIARATFRLNCLAVRILPQRKHLVVLTYHRVGNREQLWPEPADLAECSVEQFEAEMAWVRRYCTPVDLAIVEQIVHGDTPCPNRAVLVTFDDGYRDDLLRVRPILQRYDIRPIVFLSTDYVGTNRRFWWDRIGACVQMTEQKRLASSFSPEIDLPLETITQRDAAIDVLLGWAKPLAAAEREGFITRLEQDLRVGETAAASRPLVLSWDETRELCADVDIGAHTRSHPVLSTLSAEEARAELAGSKATIEEQLERPCSTVAIPYGGSMDYSPETVRVAAGVGFSMIFSLEEALRPPVHRDGLALVDRISLSPEGGLPGMAAKITWPRIFIPDWTGRIQQRASRLCSIGGGARGI